MDSNQCKVLASKVRSQHKTFKAGVSNQTVEEVAQALTWLGKERDAYVELLKLAHEKIDSQAVRIAELEEQLKPDLFWPEGGCDFSSDSIHETIESMVYDDINAQVGSVFTLDRAVKLPSQDYVLTEFDEIANSFEYEALKEQVK